MGHSCNNADELSEALKELIAVKDLRTQMGENARRCAEECFDRANSYEKLVNIIMTDRGK